MSAKNKKVKDKDTFILYNKKLDEQTNKFVIYPKVISKVYETHYIKGVKYDLIPVSEQFIKVVVS